MGECQGHPTKARRLPQWPSAGYGPRPQPGEDFYLRMVDKGENKVLSVAAKALSDSGAGCKMA